MGVFLVDVALALALLYIPSIAIYRLYFHPLARFPGPTVAALTRYFEAYYDVICGGQYTFKIDELHKKYGNLRPPSLCPHELHVNDPAFFKQLYRQDGRWDKYGWTITPFGLPSATIHSLDSHEHRRRRAALNPFFSKANVVHKQHVIETMTSKLCHRLRTLPEGVEMNLGNAISALTRDIATETIIGGSFNHLDVEDFHADLATLQQNIGGIWRTTKHIRWYGPLLESIPMSILDKIGDNGLKTFLSYTEASRKFPILTSKLADSSFPLGPGDTAHTIVHQMLASDLPPSDKTFEHLSHEVATVTTAAMETTAHSIRVTIYHLFKNLSMLSQLREELASSGVNLDLGAEGINLARLEALPYFTAVLMEGLRLSTPISSRSQRIAPDRDIWYGEWRIPAGTPVGMTLLLMHQDERLYPEPKKFEPRRWLDSSGAIKRVDQGYEPFGRGTRNCLGMYLAWAELYIIIAVLVQGFDFRLDGVGPEDVEAASDKFITATARQNGFKALVKAR
ncbi:trichodiene oxygenase [Hypoxylon sp. FL1857]|nr:trichodiene oxygenase [Hypoxylon sp. FL1857]